MKKTISKKFKKVSSRILSVLIIIAMMGTMLPNTIVFAKEQEEKYPYTMFAASDKEGAITVNAGNFCVNGDISTNGTVVSSGNMNINGTKTEHAGENMIFIFDKIDSAYFKKDDVNEYTEDYINSDTNINLNVPTLVDGSTKLNGNVNSIYALKSSGDINICGNVLNANNSVICSEYSNIIIDSSNVNLTGLLYAPLGTVRIKTQNLNLNSTIIIAQEIVIDCPNVNINYNHDMGRLIGISSEAEDIPPDEWEHMEDSNENGLPDYLEDYNNWAEMSDSDNDGIPDSIEEFIKTDKESADSDGDGLNDFYEVFITYTDPMLVDSDNNGINDADEDFDEDGLTNIQESEINTNPYNADTDEDGINDNDEVNTYKTDPLNPDTDNDRLEDEDEIFFGTDPLNPDTDRNGILDGDEKRSQTFTYENGDSVIENVSISMEATGNLQKTSDVDNIMDKDILCSEVAGLVGEPFSIETDSKFDKAVISFKVDKSKLGDTEFADLLFLWYDEENDEFVELETVCDEENSTVSVETTHFSKYMIVDSKKWIEAWTTKLDYDLDIPGIKNKTANKTVLTVCCSDTMKYNDPVTTYKYMEGPYSIVYRKTCKRIKIVDSFINKMSEADKVSIVTASYLGGSIINSCVTKNNKNLQDEINKMHEYGFGDQGTVYFEDAVARSIIGAFHTSYVDKGEYENRIILISDGHIYVQSSRSLEVYLSMARTQKKKIYTFGVGTQINENLLKYISDQTGGKYYKLSTLDELNNIYEEIGFGCNFDTIDTTDTDGDGLYDVVEKAGIRLQNGKIIRGCDPNKKDTDEDGLSDGEEIPFKLCYYRRELKNPYTNNSTCINSYCLKMYSDPTNKDTDGDGLLDGKAQRRVFSGVGSKEIAPIDPEPMKYTGAKGMWKNHIKEMNPDNIYDEKAHKYVGTIYKNKTSNTISDNKADEIWKKEIDATIEELLKCNDFIKKNESDLREKAFYFKDKLGKSEYAEKGAKILNFDLDSNNLAYHSRIDTWQRSFGYNELYDLVFRTGSNMECGRVEFNVGGDTYALWAWKGDYWNLRYGAEVGLYKKNPNVKNAKLEHFDAVDFEVPMTLSLYNYEGENNYERVFHWIPGPAQWWITGFNPAYKPKVAPDPNKMVVIASVNLYNHKELFDAICAVDNMNENDNYYYNYLKTEHVFCDKKTRTVWIQWYNERTMK